MKTMKRVLSLLLVMVTLCGVIATPAFAASTWPSLSSSGYCEMIAPGKISVYRDSGLKTRGTSSPAKSYDAYIAKNDKIYILEVTASYTKLSYPVSNGSRRIGYVKTSTLFGVTAPTEMITSKAKVTTYTGASTSTKSGNTAVGDTVYKLGTTKSGYVLVMYTAISGSRDYKAAFVTKSDYEKIKGGSGNTGNAIQISTSGTTTSPASGSFVRIRYSVNNRYLDVPAEGISDNGTQLQIWDYAPGNQNQIFQLTDTGKGWCITSLQSGKVIKVRDSSHDDCAQVAQWDKHNLACARWDIVKNSDGTVSFRNRESGKYLNVSGGNSSNGTKVIQYHDDKSYAMRFLIEPVTISGYTTTASSISSAKIKQEKDLSIRSWHPLNGLTRTMLEQDEIPESDIKLPSGVEAFNTAVDTIGFVLSWACNSSEVARIHVTEGTNGLVSIRYGTSIEQNRSGKKMSLAQMLTEAHSGEAAYVLWAASDADKCIRNWFGLSGNGKYSMEMSFGKVKYGDYGYALIIENGAIRQIPLIHSDSSYDIYYKETNQTHYVMDAADVLRSTKLPLAGDEARTVMIQLVKNGYIK